MSQGTGNNQRTKRGRTLREGHSVLEKDEMADLQGTQPSSSATSVHQIRPSNAKSVQQLRKRSATPSDTTGLRCAEIVAGTKYSAFLSHGTSFSVIQKQQGTKKQVDMYSYEIVQGAESQEHVLTFSLGLSQALLLYSIFGTGSTLAAN